MSKPNADLIKKAYGYCLNLAGITDADKIIDLLLDQNNNLYFTHYVPLSWFEVFAEDFIEYAVNQIDLCQWDADKTKIQKPSREKPIYKHYADDFLPAFK